MKIRFAAGCAAFAVGALAFAGISAARTEPGAIAWNTSRIYVPAKLATNNADCESDIGGKCERRIRRGKHPVIVFLHGCGGRRDLQTFTGLGAIVVAPNSFADGAACKRDAEHMLNLVADRHADAAYAAKKIKAGRWADPDKLILAGYSHGGWTAATYPGNEFKARVILGWACKSAGGPAWNVKGSGPALAVIGTEDEIYKRISVSDHCGHALARREGSRSVLIQGGTHKILNHDQTRAAVATFVGTVIR